ncbi:MAG TPA: DUF4142 domain-containing protein [Rudaea sp.]|nr:DUF4142 domain-containing protein [Rudaea sp.]
MRGIHRSTRSALVAVFALAAASAQAQIGGTSEPKTAAESPDAEFVQQAARAGMAGVELSRLAERAAASPDVRRFAAQTIRDRDASDRELNTIATHENIAPAKELDRDDARVYDRLAALHGPELDRAYMEAMRVEHERLLDLYRSSQGTVSTDELRAYIRKTLPAIEARLRAAQHVKTG